MKLVSSGEIAHNNVGINGFSDSYSWDCESTKKTQEKDQGNEKE